VTFLNLSRFSNEVEGVGESPRSSHIHRPADALKRHKNKNKRCTALVSTREKEETSKRKVYTAPALEKGLDILELLSSEPKGLTINEIVSRLNRSVGELFRMLVVLEQRGYVYLAPGSDKYALTLRMFSLAHRFPPVKHLTRISGEVMHRLSYKIEQSCHLVIYYEGKGHVVVQQDSPSARIFSVRLGAEVPLLQSCSGHVLLAFSGKYQREQMLTRTLSAQQDIDMEQMLDKIEKQGYENIKSGLVQGIHDIGYPVFDYTENVVAALVVPFVVYSDNSLVMSMEESQKQIRDAAVEISESLGYQLG